MCISTTECSLTHPLSSSTWVLFEYEFVFLLWLFEAYFAQRQNIGDRDVLRAIAEECGIAAEIVDKAWSDQGFEQRLRDQFWRAAQIGVQGVPAFLFGRYIVSGAVPAETLRRAAEYVLNEMSHEEGEA